MLRLLIVLFVCPALSSQRSLISPESEFDYDAYVDLRSDLRKAIASPALVRDWPEKQLELGQTSGVTIDRDGNVVLVHRGPVIWDQDSFNSTNHYQHTSASDVISDDVILVLDPKTGAVVRTLGAKRFYMPHGITADSSGNLWVTDVALHQVIRLDGTKGEPSLTVGEKFQPGSDDGHFCKPTAVAVAASGEFYVADGYCNSRIMKFDSKGKLQTQWGQDKKSSPFLLPHGIDLDEVKGQLCVADREHGRVICFNVGPNDQSGGELLAEAPFRSAVYDVKISGNEIYAVTQSETDGSGFTADRETGEVVDIWSQELNLVQPHALAISGSDIYVVQVGPNTINKLRLVTPQPHNNNWGSI